MKKHSALIPYLTRARWRIRFRDGVLLAQKSLWMAVSGAMLMLILFRLFPIEQRYLVWSPGIFWLIGCIGYSLFYPISPMRVARRIDSELDLKERLSSSLAFETMVSSQSFKNFDRGLVELANEDALLHAQRIVLDRDFPIRFERKPVIIASGLILASLILSILPNQMDLVIAERKIVAQVTAQQAEKIEKLNEEIEKSQEMSPEERDQLLQRLKELADQLRANQGDREQALADLSKLEAELKQKIDPKTTQRQSALAAVAAQMQALAQQENAQTGDLDAAAEALEQLAEQMASMSEEELEALAQQLSEMAARAAQAGDGAIAQALASMAQSARVGDIQSVQQSAQQGSNALKQAESNLANQQAMNQALAQIQSSRQQISFAGQGQQRAQSGQGNQDQGQSPGQAQGQNPGQAQGQGQAAGGGGTNANSLPPSTRTGNAADPQGQGTNTGASDLDSQVYIPRERLQAIEGEDVFVPGQDTEQGETQVKEQFDPLGGASNPALVTYNAVYQEYLNAANEAIDQSYIPSDMKDYVREYFSQLEP